jgi:hypothetical protein
MRAVWTVALGVALGIQALAPCARAGQTDAKRTEIIIPGAPGHGIFDPSIVSNGRGKLYMALSGVHAVVPGGGFDTYGVSTYLAVSSNQGKSWKLLGVINPAIQVQLGRKPRRGIWQSEVPVLAFDPQAPKQARWKLIWHQYLNIKGDRKFEHGWIAYKEAATPRALASAKPMKLFTAWGYDKVNSDPSGWTRPAIPGPGVNKLHKMVRGLKNCVALSEAGMMAKPDALYLSMMCFKPKLLGLLGASHHVILLKCARPCNATAPGAWSYVGTVLTPDDAKNLNLRKFCATDLFSEGGHDYITVSPVGKVPVKSAYKGCYVFRFADLARGKVERRGDGRPAVVTRISLNKKSFNGACSFLPVGPAKGLVIGQVEFFLRNKKPGAIFHLYNTNTAP